MLRGRSLLTAARKSNYFLFVFLGVYVVSVRTQHATPFDFTQLLVDGTAVAHAQLRRASAYPLRLRGGRWGREAALG